MGAICKKLMRIDDEDDESYATPKISFIEKIKSSLHYHPTKFWPYLVCFLVYAITITIGVLLLISKQKSTLLIYGEFEDIPVGKLAVIIGFNFWIFGFNLFLFYGLKFNVATLLFLWILSMLITWNMYLFDRTIHLLDLAIASEKNIADLYAFIFHVFPIIIGWLLIIGIVWDYWQKISTITDIPELVDFLIQWHNLRSSSTEIRDHGHVRFEGPSSPHFKHKTDR